MRNEGFGGVWKVWLYAAASLLLGAWSAPLVYNAGKALAEVSARKATNGPLEWLAGHCGTADFPAFYAVALLLAALVLFIPWMEWLHSRSSGGTGGAAGPWRLRLRPGAQCCGRGQPLTRNPRGLWHCCAGFLLVAGLLLSMGVALVPAGLFTMRGVEGGNGMLALRTGIIALVAAGLLEVFFRGIVMGVFLRAMRPSAALGMSAAFFALVLSAFPWGGVNVADPEASGTGFELLGEIAAGFADGRFIWGRFVPLVALGGVLAYARWRTASLWMPIGLHAGWLFSRAMLGGLTLPAAGATAREWVASGGLLQQGLVPMLGIFLAGLLAHFLTERSDDEHPAQS